jgi:hypothetical protein
MEATNLAGLYNLPPLDWSRIEARLEEGLSHHRLSRVQDPDRVRGGQRVGQRPLNKPGNAG